MSPLLLWVQADSRNPNGKTNAEWLHNLSFEVRQAEWVPSEWFPQTYSIIATAGHKESTKFVFTGQLPEKFVDQLSLFGIFLLREIPLVAQDTQKTAINFTVFMSLVANRVHQKIEIEELDIRSVLS